MISFDKQLQRQENDINVVANRIEMLSFKSERATRKIDEYERGMVDILRDVSKVLY